MSYVVWNTGAGSVMLCWSLNSTPDFGFDIDIIYVSLKRNVSRSRNNDPVRIIEIEYKGF